MSAYVTELWAELRSLEAKAGQIREALRAAGETVPQQRIRIRYDTNAKLTRALYWLRTYGEAGATRYDIAGDLDVSADYAYDLLAALLAQGYAERIKVGLYRAKAGA